MVDISASVLARLKNRAKERGSTENRGLSAMKAASRIAEKNGISDMSLDEINAEIAAARK